MVETFHTVVADRTMRATWRPVQHAGITVFCFHSDSVDIDILNSGQTQRWSLVCPDLGISIKTFRFWRMCIARYDTRIPPRSEKQKSQILKSGIKYQHFNMLEDVLHIYKLFHLPAKHSTVQINMMLEQAKYSTK
jgi:hypothetical protein